MEMTIPLSRAAAKASPSSTSLLPPVTIQSWNVIIVNWRGVTAATRTTARA